MATFDQLYDFTMPTLPGAEPGIIDFHIRRVLREFFKRTTVWREVFEFDTIVAPVTTTYSLQPTSGTVAAVLRVDIDARYAPPVPEEKRDPHALPGVPVGWYGLLPQVMTLYPAPNSIVPVRVEAAITLAVDGTDRNFPDEVFSEHAEALAAGVIGAMLMIPGKPWTKRDAAGTYSRIFGSAVRDTRGKLRDGGMPNQSTFTGPRFGA
jgi:hypothetical protein